MNVFPFDGRSKEQKILDAISLLEKEGYLVRGPLLKASSVKSPLDLVKFFYDKMAQYNPDLLMYYSSSRRQDLAAAKKLIQSRIDVGSGSERAMTECCTLIESLFKYEEYLELSFKITSMGVLGQDSMAWVSQKLTDVINGFNRPLEVSKEERWFDRYYKENEGNLPQEVINKSNRRLGIEDEDGKEED